MKKALLALSLLLPSCASVDSGEAQDNLLLVIDIVEDGTKIYRNARAIYKSVKQPPPVIYPTK